METPTTEPKKRAKTSVRINLEHAEAKALATHLTEVIRGLATEKLGPGDGIMADILSGILAKLQTPTP